MVADGEMWSPKYCDENGENCNSIGTSTSTSTSNTSDCVLAYRFRRNATENEWQTVALNTTSQGEWSTWSAGKLDDECNGAGCGIQMATVCDGDVFGYDWSVGAWGGCTPSRPITRCEEAVSGTHYRGVSCVASPYGDVVGDSQCSGTKPVTTGGCTAYGAKCPATCFVADTQVTMTDGTIKNIQDVQIGESVLGDDCAINNVTGYDRPMLGDRLLYSFNGGKYFVTAEHPFLTIDGWKSISPEALVKENPSLAEKISVTVLKVGDSIILENGTVEEITRIESKKADDQQLYNLMLDGNNTYYVDGYTTHNKP